MIRVLRPCFVSDLSRTVAKGVYPVGNGAGEIPVPVARHLVTMPRFAEVEEGELPEDDGGARSGRRRKTPAKDKSPPPVDPPADPPPAE